MSDRYTAVHNGVAPSSVTLVAARTGSAIRVTSIHMHGGTVVTTLTFTNGQGGSSLSGDILCLPNSGPDLDFAEEGYFETAGGAALGLTIAGAAGATSNGYITYSYVP